MKCHWLWKVALRIAVSTLHHCPSFLQGLLLLAKPFHSGSDPVLIRVMEKLQSIGLLLFVAGKGRGTCLYMIKYQHFQLIDKREREGSTREFLAKLLFSVALAETIYVACGAVPSRVSMHSTSNKDRHFQKVRVLEQMLMSSNSTVSNRLLSKVRV